MRPSKHPRRACAARVTVLGLSFRLSVFPSVRLSVCYHAFCHYAQQGGQKAIPTGSVPHWLDFKNGDFRKSTAFKSYGVKTKRTSQYANEHGLPRPDFLPVSTTVEAVEVTRRASMWSWFAKNESGRILQSSMTHHVVSVYMYKSPELLFRGRRFIRGLVPPNLVKIVEHSCAMLVAVGKLPSFSASVLIRYTECWCCLLVVCCCLLVVCCCLLVRSYSERAQKSSYESYAPGYVPSLNSFRRQHGTRTAPQPSRQFNIE